jgi:pyruvate-ferredoxin/flavodoxin oxidoreductase
MTAFAEAAADGRRPMPRIIGGRYGLASKEFTRHGPGRVRRTGRPSPGGSSPSASSTM